jgi:tRNA(Ile)-lysidine synthase TilS/MesJ
MLLQRITTANEAITITHHCWKLCEIQLIIKHLQIAVGKENDLTKCQNITIMAMCNICRDIKKQMTIKVI